MSRTGRASGTLNRMTAETMDENEIQEILNTPEPTREPGPPTDEEFWDEFDRASHQKPRLPKRSSSDNNELNTVDYLLMIGSPVAVVLIVWAGMYFFPKDRMQEFIGQPLPVGQEVQGWIFGTSPVYGGRSEGSEIICQCATGVANVTSDGTDWLRVNPITIAMRDEDDEYIYLPKDALLYIHRSKFTTRFPVEWPKEVLDEHQEFVKQFPFE